MQELINFTANIQRMRLYRKVTKEKAKDKVYVDYSTYCGYENGNPVPLDIALIISKAFNVSFAEMLKKKPKVKTPYELTKKPAESLEIFCKNILWETGRRNIPIVRIAHQYGYHPESIRRALSQRGDMPLKMALELANFVELDIISLLKYELI